MSNFAVKLETGISFGTVPPTPLDHQKDISMSEAYSTLLNVALRYGRIIGYKQEQEGKLIHHLFPIKKTESEQISTSSKVDLALHTETAFHQYRPDYVVLACLRGDENAATTYADIEKIVKLLDDETIDELKKKQFTTRVDVSFRSHGENDQEVKIAVLEETSNGYRITHDETFVRGDTARGQQALDKLNSAIACNIEEVILKAGDVLIINNDRAIHGRKPFTAKYDGTDRWLLRCLVRKELPPVSDRIGSVITTTRFK
jgi:alpha-ketoglutarate-dependent taurine dioxygenase